MTGAVTISSTIAECQLHWLCGKPDNRLGENKAFPKLHLSEKSYGEKKSRRLPKAHVFVADDRREGPHERRADEARRRERERERKKIERIRAFKQQDNVPSPAAPMLTKKRLIYLACVLLILVVAVLLIK